MQQMKQMKSAHGAQKLIGVGRVQSPEQCQAIQREVGKHYFVAIPTNSDSLQPKDYFCFVGGPQSDSPRYLPSNAHANAMGASVAQKCPGAHQVVSRADVDTIGYLTLLNPLPYSSYDAQGGVVRAPPTHLSLLAKRISMGYNAFTVALVTGIMMEGTWVEFPLYHDDINCAANTCAVKNGDIVYVRHLYGHDKVIYEATLYSTQTKV